MTPYSIGDLGRREILKMSAVFAGSGVILSTKLVWCLSIGVTPATPALIIP
jgi:hypothetical protein